MPQPRAELELADVMEIAEVLTFIRRWLSGADRELLDASFRRFVGVENYPIEHLRSDLARFTFLLGYDDGETLFDADEVDDR
jgi:hypothetical protein